MHYLSATSSIIHRILNQIKIDDDDTWKKITHPTATNAPDCTSRHVDFKTFSGAAPYSPYRRE